jgi:TrmH family RNA methyltransferase
LQQLIFAKVLIKGLYKMISKSTIKSIRLLHQKKYREELGLFIAEGPKVVNELIQCGYSAKELFTADDSWANDAANPTLISEKELASISCLHTPNKVLGVFAIPQRILDTTSLKGKLVLVLDDIRDPGNLGTMIRMADWFGIATILCSENCVDVFNPKTVQATMGSLARVNVHYESLMEVLPHFENVYAATLNYLPMQPFLSGVNRMVFRLC